MYYIELIERLWNFNKTNQIGSTGISMYLYLLKIGYDCDCYDLQVSDVSISNELGLTGKTVKSTKEKLRNLGLIRFETKNGLPCHYRLIVNYSLQISEPEKLNQEKVQRKVTSQRSEILEIPSQQLLPIKDTLENFPKIGNKHIKTDTLESLETITDDKSIPTMEEFMAYATTLENYQSHLDPEIQSKYEDWKTNGWKNSSDRPITNWRSSLKSTLPFMKNAIEDNLQSIRSIPNIKRPKSQNGDLKA